MLPLRLAFILFLVAIAAYGVWEVRRWATPSGQDVSPRQRTLRVWGLFFLLLTLGLCLGWTYLPKPQTRPELVGYARYIILICVSILPLLPLALMDWRENMRHMAESRRALMAETLGRDTDPPPPV